MSERLVRLSTLVAVMLAGVMLLGGWGRCGGGLAGGSPGARTHGAGALGRAGSEASFRMPRPSFEVHPLELRSWSLSHPELLPRLRATRDVRVWPERAGTLRRATDLDDLERYLVHQLRVAQEGTIQDLGGLAARWQHRPVVRISDLRRGTIADDLDEAPAPIGAARPPAEQPPTFRLRVGHLEVEVSPPHRGCDAHRRTPPIGDDC